MKAKENLSIEQLWDDLLSQDDALIITAFDHLSSTEQEAVFAHLQKMTKETGWFPAQKESAQAAIEAIQKNRKGSR